VFIFWALVEEIPLLFVPTKLADDQNSSKSSLKKILQLPGSYQVSSIYATATKPTCPRSNKMDYDLFSFLYLWNTRYVKEWTGGKSALLPYLRNPQLCPTVLRPLHAVGNIW